MLKLVKFVPFFYLFSNPVFADPCFIHVKEGKTLSAIQCYANQNSEHSEYNLAEMLSFVGQNDKADQIINKYDAQNNFSEPNVTIADKLSAYDAATTIATFAKNKKVVMLNEAHHHSAHRIFALELARQLKDKGFTYLAMEALVDGEQTQKLGYATYQNPTAGIYTADPAFAHLIKESVDMGYTLTSYEARNTGGIAQREEAQAENLKKILDKDPEAKILVYAGYGHIRKLKSAGEELMANRFQRKTGITPFTIDQVAGTHSFYKNLNDPVLAYVAKNYPVKLPVVFKKRSGDWLVSDSYAGDADITVFHPDYGYAEGRPDWLKSGRSKYKVPHHLLGNSRPVLVRAVYQNANEFAVPVDQFVLSADEDYALYLPPGKFRIEIQTYDSTKNIGVVDVSREQAQLPN